MLKSGSLRHVTSRHMTLDLFGETKRGPPVVLRTIMGEFFKAILLLAWE